MNGKWVKGPGAALFEALRQALGDLPIVAENLGVTLGEKVQLIAPLTGTAALCFPIAPQ